MKPGLLITVASSVSVQCAVRPLKIDFMFQVQNGRVRTKRIAQSARADVKHETRLIVYFGKSGSFITINQSSSVIRLKSKKYESTKIYLRVAAKIKAGKLSNCKK